MAKTTLIYNADIINEFKRFFGYILIEDELRSKVGEGHPSEYILSTANELIDANRNLVIPGVIDDQVHFRDPGLTHKGDIITESMAAVAGGTTSFMDMPNTNPPTTTLEALDAKNERAEANSLANYSFFIGATNDNLDVLKKIDFNHTCGVKLFLGSSTGNMLVDNQETIRRIFSEVPAIMAIHSEDEPTIYATQKAYIDKYGENLTTEFHPLIISTTR